MLEDLKEEGRLKFIKKPEDVRRPDQGELKRKQERGIRERVLKSTQAVQAEILYIINNPDFAKELKKRIEDEQEEVHDAR